jgi:hypothetical protein
MCDKQETLAANKQELERIIAGLDESFKELRTAQAENTGKLTKMGNDASEILVKIRAENLTSKLEKPILHVASIEGIRDDYAGITRAFDVLTTGLANSISSSRSKLTQYTQGAEIVTREIEACIETRKTAANKMVAEATILKDELTRKEAECNVRIAALEAIANTETENQGLKLRIAALKVAHSTFQGELKAIESSPVPITSVSGYQTGLEDAGAVAGASKLNALSELALKSIETLTAQNNQLDDILAELKAGEVNTDAITQKIESEKAQADERKAVEEVKNAAEAKQAAADKEVVRELADMESVSIYLPTPATKRPQAGNQSDSSSQSDPLELEEVEPETILEFVVNRPAEPGAAGSGSGSRGGSIRHRGKRQVLQRGGLGEGGPIVLRITKLTPEVQKLLLEFEPLNKVLTKVLFNKIIEGVTPISRVDAAMEYTKIARALIPSNDTGSYFDTLGQKVAWKTSIMKLMNFLDKQKVRKSQSSKPYSDMYNDLWTFMERDSGSIAKLREIFRDKTIDSNTLEASLINKGKLDEIRNKVGWKSRTQNSLFDNLYNVFSHCKIIEKAKPTESTFLTDRTSTKANSMYRFKLNWLILIAFHIYHTAKPENQRQLLIDICEFVENLYNIFVGWMIDMDAKSLDGEFMPKTTQSETYIIKTTKLITAESTDGSLTRLREAIRYKLCEFGPIKERISAARAVEAAKAAAVAAKLPASSRASSQASSRSSSPTSAPAPAYSVDAKVPPKKAWGEETQVQPPRMVTPSPPVEPSPRLRKVREMTDAEQNAAAEEARLRLNAKDAAEAAAAGLSQGNVVTDGPWKTPFIKPPSQPKEAPPQYIRKFNQDHPGYKNLKAIADAGKLRRIDEMNARLGPEIGPSRESIEQGKSAALDRANAKLPPTPPLTSSTNPRRSSRTFKPFDGSIGGNKQRTRKRQRIARAHHNTKRRILRNKNHKHTRKARQVRASVSV